MGYDDPTCESVDATTVSFHKCLKEILSRVKVSSIIVTVPFIISCKMLEGVALIIVYVIWTNVSKQAIRYIDARYFRKPSCQ